MNQRMKISSPKQKFAKRRSVSWSLQRAAILRKAVKAQSGGADCNCNCDCNC